MIIKATQKNTRQTARKVRLIANSVKKLPLVDAVKQLAVIERRSTLVVLKVLKQAISNAVHNHGFKIEELTIKNITVAPGPQLKRFRAVSRGRAHNIVKRSCHITVEIEAGESKKDIKSAVEKSKVNEEKTQIKTKTDKKVKEEVSAVKNVSKKSKNLKEKKKTEIKKTK
ncbi:MAG: 50S ribosomal protein L22 [Pseudomonadales bacterium]|nr:50S ribosomal protein L22 [Pseudomonadales bacterium]